MRKDELTVGRVTGKLTADGVIKLRLAVSSARSREISKRLQQDRRTKCDAYMPAYLDGQSKLQDLLKQDREPKTGHGGHIRARRFTRYAAQWIREAAACLERECGTNVVFCTATLPGSTTAAMKVLAAYSSYLTELLNQWLRDNVEGVMMIGVWEFQKRGALHLHWAVGRKAPGGLEVIKTELKTWWCKVLARLSRETGIDLFGRQHGGSWAKHWNKVQVDVEPVRKSISRYLSKYITKGHRLRNNEHAFPPASWWSCSSAIKQLVRSARKETGSIEVEVITAKQGYEHIASILKACSQSNFQFENVWRPGDANVWCQFSWDSACATWEWLTDWIWRCLDHSNTHAKVSALERYQQLLAEQWQEYINQ